MNIKHQILSNEVHYLNKNNQRLEKEIQKQQNHF
jgi:hypothetical protein